MLQVNYTAKLKKLISDLAKDYEPEVKRIENKASTTPDHYADYMAILSHYNRLDAEFIGLALIQIGANKQGVENAYNCVFRLNLTY